MYKQVWAPLLYNLLSPGASVPSSLISVESRITIEIKKLIGFLTHWLLPFCTLIFNLLLVFIVYGSIIKFKNFFSSCAWPSISVCLHDFFSDRDQRIFPDWPEDLGDDSCILLLPRFPPHLWRFLYWLLGPLVMVFSEYVGYDVHHGWLLHCLVSQV